MADDAMQSAPLTADPLHRMTGGFAEINDRLGHLDPVADLAVIVDVLLAQVPASVWATITVRAGAGWTTAASTDDRGAAVEQVQYRLGLGPSLLAFEERVVRVDDLATDPRWPALWQAVSTDPAGAPRSVLAVNLQADDHATIGTLTAYAPAPSAFSPAAADTAVLLAGFAAAVIGIGRAQRSVDNLQVALETSREIGVAVGVLMATRLVDRHAAFELLRTASQTLNRKLRDIATEVVDTGLLPGRPTTEGTRRDDRT